MALRDDLQRDLAAAFDGDLADAVRAFTLTRTVEGEYDPITGDESTSTQTFESRGVFGGFKMAQVDDQHILVTDEKLTVLQNELGTDPAIGDDIAGKRVMNVWQDPAGAAWTIQLRSA